MALWGNNHGDDEDINMFSHWKEKFNGSGQNDPELEEIKGVLKECKVYLEKRRTITAKYLVNKINKFI